MLLVNRSGTMVIVFLSLYLTQKLSFSLAAAGQILSAYGVGHVVGTFLGGWLCHRIGAMRIQLFALAASGVGYLLMERLQTMGALMVAAFLVATTAEAFRPANMAALAAFSPPELRTRAMAINRMAINLGFSFGASLGGFLAKIDYAWLFWVDGVTCIAAAVLLGVLFRGRMELPAEEEEVNEATASRKPQEDYLFLVFIALLFVFMVCFFQAWSTLPVFYYEVYGISETAFGLLMAGNGLLIMAFEVVLTHQAERFRALYVTAAGIFFCGLGYGVLPLGRGLGMAMVSMVIWTVGEMLAMPFAAGWAANRSGAAQRGFYMGFYTTAFGLAFVLAPTLGSWTYESLSGDTLWWIILGLSTLVTLGCILLGRAEIREEALRSEQGQANQKT